MSRDTSQADNIAQARSLLAKWLETAALFVLLLVVAMRPLLAETYESSLHSIAQVVGTVGATTPATTAWFDLAIWLAAVFATLSIALRGLRWRWTGMEIGAALLLFAAIVSTIAASNQRLAANASSDWLTAIAMFMVLANLCRDRWRVALLLAAITASGLTTAAKCIMQVNVEFAEVRDQYDQNKADFWEQQGVALDDPRVELFEHRMDAREATGFFSHSNTAGSWLSLAGFAALGLGGLATQKPSQRALWFIVAAVLFGTILTTGSKGALAATILGIGLWLILMFAQRVVRRNWRSALAGAWLAIIIVIAGVAWTGMTKGSLPGSSLAFRWNYWQVTSKIIADHPWTGTGALNFDRAYLKHKPIEYPEEIKDPHNFALAILSQWGISGGVGLVLGLIGASYVAARTFGQHGSEDESEPPQKNVARRSVIFWIAAGVCGFILLRLWLFRDLWMGDIGEQAFVFFDLVFYCGLLWTVSFTAALWLNSTASPPNGDTYRLACLCGVIVFLLHNTIGFSMFLPGTLTPFMAMAGLLLGGLKRTAPDQPTAIHRFLPSGLAVAGLVVFLLVTLIPVTRSSHLLARARQSTGAEVERYYRAAAAADVLDPTPLEELARWYAQTPHLDRDHMTKAYGAITQAISRDQKQIALYRMRSRVLEQSDGSTTTLLGALGNARQVVKMYPQSPDDHVALADLLVRATKANVFTPEYVASFISEAIGHYRQALDLDATRPEYELRRWPTVRRAQIASRLREFEATSTQPSSGPN